MKVKDFISIVQVKELWLKHNDNEFNYSIRVIENYKIREQVYNHYKDNQVIFVNFKNKEVYIK